MALTLTKQLLITFDDILSASSGSKAKLFRYTNAEKETCLQFVHDFMLLDNDSVYVSDSRWLEHINRQLQTAIGCHYAVLQSDTPAGTGSMSGKSIESFSVSYTMAKNNAPFNDWLNMTQYGTRFLNIINQKDPSVRYMI